MAKRPGRAGRQRRPDLQRPFFLLCLFLLFQHQHVVGGATTNPLAVLEATGDVQVVFCSISFARTAAPLKQAVAKVVTIAIMWRQKLITGSANDSRWATKKKQESKEEGRVRR